MNQQENTLRLHRNRTRQEVGMDYKKLILDRLLDRYEKARLLLMGLQGEGY